MLHLTCVGRQALARFCNQAGLEPSRSLSVHLDGAAATAAYGEGRMRRGRQATTEEKEEDICGQSVSGAACLSCGVVIISGLGGGRDEPGPVQGLRLSQQQAWLRLVLRPHVSHPPTYPSSIIVSCPWAAPLPLLLIWPSPSHSGPSPTRAGSPSPHLPYRSINHYLPGWWLAGCRSGFTTDNTYAGLWGASLVRDCSSDLEANYLPKTQHILPFLIKVGGASSPAAATGWLRWLESARWADGWCCLYACTVCMSVCVAGWLLQDLVLGPQADDGTMPLEYQVRRALGPHTEGGSRQDGSRKRRRLVLARDRC